jgi:hypothetical protein
MAYYICSACFDGLIENVPPSPFERLLSTNVEKLYFFDKHLTYNVF